MARMRKVSGDSQALRCRRRSPGLAGTGVVAGTPATKDGAPPPGARDALTVAVAISDAIKRLDLREVVVDRLELLAQPFDVAVDGTVVDVDVLAVVGVHQLVAALDMAGPERERFEDEELR